MADDAPIVVRWDMNEVEGLRLEVLQMFQEDDVPVSLAVASLLHAAGSLLAPRDYDEETAVLFIKWMMENGTLFFADRGTIN